MALSVRPGSSYPLGAAVGADGTNVAVHSSVAEQVQLCVFDAAGTETRLVALRLDGLGEPEERADGSVLVDSDVALLVAAGVTVSPRSVVVLTRMR